MSIAVENLIITQLISYLNDHRTAPEDDPDTAVTGLPCDVYNNEHEETGEQLWIQPNTGERKGQMYIGGSYRGYFPFTLCYQYTNAGNADGRRAVLDLPFYALAEYLEGQNGAIQLGDTKVTIEMLTHPAISWASEDGQTIEHSATFRLEYHVKRPVEI